MFLFGWSHVQCLTQPVKRNDSVKNGSVHFCWLWCINYCFTAVGFAVDFLKRKKACSVELIDYLLRRVKLFINLVIYSIYVRLNAPDHQTENLRARSRSAAPPALLKFMPQRTNKHKSTYINRRGEVMDVCVLSWCLSHQRKIKGIQWKRRAACCILPIAFSHQGYLLASCGHFEDTVWVVGEPGV